MILSNIKNLLLVKPEADKPFWLAKLYNLFVILVGISIFIHIIGQSIMIIALIIWGPGQAGHVTPGPWMLALPFIFIGAIAVAILKVLGFLISAYTLFKKYLAKHFVLATLTLFILTGWGGGGGILGYLFNWMHRTF